MSLEKVDVAARDAVLRHTDRGEVKLSDYWTQGTTVFIFLRHFG